MAPRKKSVAAQIAEYSALAFVLPAATLTGYGLGYLLDKAFHTHFLMIVGLILGSVGGFIQIIRQLTRGSDGDAG